MGRDMDFFRDFIYGKYKARVDRERIEAFLGNRVNREAVLNATANVTGRRSPPTREDVCNNVIAQLERSLPGRGTESGATLEQHISAFPTAGERSQRAEAAEFPGGPAQERKSAADAGSIVAKPKPAAVRWTERDAFLEADLQERRDLKKIIDRNNDSLNVVAGEYKAKNYNVVMESVYPGSGDLQFARITIRGAKNPGVTMENRGDGSVWVTNNQLKSQIDELAKRSPDFRDAYVPMSFKNAEEAKAQFDRLVSEAKIKPEASQPQKQKSKTTG